MQTSMVTKVARDQQKSTTTTTTVTASPAADVLAFSAVLESFCVNSYTSEPLLVSSTSTTGLVTFLTILFISGYLRLNNLYCYNKI